MNETDTQASESDQNSDEWKSWPPEFFLTVLLPEIWTPLTVIKGYTEILADEKMKAHRPQALDSISKNIEKIENLCYEIAEYRNELQSRHSV